LSPTRLNRFGGNPLHPIPPPDIVNLQQGIPKTPDRRSAGFQPAADAFCSPDRWSGSLPLSLSNGPGQIPELRFRSDVAQASSLLPWSVQVGNLRYSSKETCRLAPYAAFSRHAPRPTEPVEQGPMTLLGEEHARVAEIVSWHFSRAAKPEALRRRRRLLYFGGAFTALQPWPLARGKTCGRDGEHSRLPVGDH
jgi:hypothetical protein